MVVWWVVGRVSSFGGKLDIDVGGLVVGVWRRINDCMVGCTCTIECY